MRLNGLRRPGWLVAVCAVLAGASIGALPAGASTGSTAPSTSSVTATTGSAPPTTTTTTGTGTGPLSTPTLTAPPSTTGTTATVTGTSTTVTGTSTAASPTTTSASSPTPTNTTGAPTSTTATFIPTTSTPPATATQPQPAGSAGDLPTEGAEPLPWGKASQWQAWLGQPAQVAARKASQSEFEEQSAKQALTTDSGAFEGWIGQPGYQSPLVQWQGQVLKRLGKYSASVENSSRKPQILVSTAPLEGTTPSGAAAPLDLSLTSAGSAGFAPQSAAVPVTLPTSSDGQINVQEPGPEPGFSVGFASGTAAAGVQQGATVFYANVGGASDDTDVVANAIPDGAEVSYVLRSAESPQTQALTFSLPQGWSLAPSSVNPRNVSIISSGGTVEATVMAPVAMDAQGRTVPVSYTIQGSDSIQLIVQDQGGDYAFPVEVDPNIDEGGADTFAGWTPFDSNAGNSSSPIAEYPDYGWTFSPLAGYVTNSQGNFTLNAGPADAYIEAFYLYDVYNAPDTHNPSDAAFDAGIQPSGGGIGNYVAGSWASTSGNSGAQWAWRSYSGTISDDTYIFTAAGTNGTTAEFDLRALETTNQGVYAAEDWADEANVYALDNDAAPTVQVTNEPIQWVNNTKTNVTESVTVSANQPGDYGVGELDLVNPSGTIIASNASDWSCGANGNIYCDDIPSSVTLNYNTAGLTDGEEGYLVASAYDGSQAPPVPIPLGVDNSAPVVTTVNGTMGSGGGSVQISATAGDANSGVQNITAMLDGNQVAPTSSTYPCESSTGAGCETTATFDPTLTPGWHKVTVGATDWAGNPATSVTDEFPTVATPSTSGTYAVGQTVTAVPAALPGGKPAGAQTPLYSYQWMSCGPTGQSCTSISGASGSSYTVSSRDVGSEIELQQTAAIPDTGIVETSTTSPSQLIEPASGPACTDSWLPSTSSNWGVATNWSAGHSPGPTDVVCVRPTTAEIELSIGGSVTIAELQASGAVINLVGSVTSTGAPLATLTITGTSTVSNLGHLLLGSPNASSRIGSGQQGALDVSPGAALQLDQGLEWNNGTIGGGGTVTLAQRSSSLVYVGILEYASTLNDATLINKGSLELLGYGNNGYGWADMLGENGAVLDNQGQLTVDNGTTATPALGLGLKQVAGAESTFENQGTLVATGSTYLVDAWNFTQTAPGATSDVPVTLLGGETNPIAGNWGASLTLDSGGPYAITDDLTNFGGAAITVAAGPGATGGAATAMLAFMGASTSAPGLTIANVEMPKTAIAANGPLTVGQAGVVTTVGALTDGDGAPITTNGTVNAQSYTAGTGTLTENGPFTVYGATTLATTETVTGGGTVDFRGPISVPSAGASITDTSSGLVLGGNVTGTGNLTITVGGSFYEQGGVNLTGNLSVQSSASADIQLTGAVTLAGQLALNTGGRVDSEASVNATSMMVSAAQSITIGGQGWDAAGAVNLTSPGAITVYSLPSGGDTVQSGAITVAGGGTATVDGAVSTGALTVNQELFDNEGALAIGARLLAEDGSQIVNDGQINANNAVFAETPTGPGSSLINDDSGQLVDTGNPSGVTDVVALPYSGSGSVSSAYIINDSGAAQYGGANPATPDMVPADCDGSTDCGNGDQTEQQTDLSVAGLGGDLALTRSYSSRLASSESSPGLFGYGWITPFEQRLVVDAAQGTATVTTATGSTVAFTDNSGTFTGGTGVYATLTSNSNGDYTYVQPDQTTTVFGPTGLPLSVTNRQGQVTTYTYNGQGQLTQVAAPSAASGISGRTITFTYIASGNGAGLVGTASDPAGLTVSYSYDPNGNLIGVSDSQGANVPEGTSGSAQPEWSFQYDGDGGVSTNDTTDLHELTSITDADGYATTMTYQGGYLTSRTDPMGRTETWQYELVNNGSADVENAESETIQTSPGGNVTTYYMNSLDEPIVTFEPDGGVEQFAYDSNGDLTSETSANGNTTKYTYDAIGDKITQTDPLGNETQWNYNQTTRDLNYEIVPSGLKTSYIYDGGGEPTSVTETGTGASEDTTMAYNSYEELTSKTTDLGHATTYTYDSYGDLATQTDALGNETTYGYDADGRQTCMTVPRVTAAGSTCVGASSSPVNAETQKYDLLGDLLSSVTAAGNTTTYSYDADQRKLSATDPDSHTTSYTYDKDGEPTQTTLADGSTQTSTYSAEGNVLTQTNGDTDTYTYTYNSMDQLASSSDPAGNKTTYGYDYDGNLTTIGYPNGKTTTYTYDQDDRKSTTSYSDGEAGVSYSYSPDGQLGTMVDGSGTTNYTYDTLDRLTSVCTDATSSGSGCPGGRVVSYGYNADNDQTSIGYPNGDSVTQTFNTDDQLSTVKDWLADTTTFGYTKDSGLSTITFPTGTGETDTYGYNLDDALTGITMAGASSNIATIGYTRDPDDLITAQSQTGLPGPTSETLSYTKTLELASVTPASQSTINYSYDKAKNITELDGNATALAYNSDSELTTGPAGTYSYNNLGERTGYTPSSGSASSYTYDQNQDLTAATTPTGRSVSDTYNAADQLMSSTTSGTTTTFTWDDTATDPALLQVGSESYIYGPDGAPIEQISSSGTVQYLHHDEIGSTRVITTSAGTVAGTFTYNPYGATTGTLAGSTGTATSLIGYAGEYTDPNTGLIYMQARWYDPSTGQFMVVDPKVESTWTPYAYATDDPISNTDPTGLDPSEEAFGGGVDGAADDDPESQAFLYYEVNAQEGNATGETPGEAFAAGAEAVEAEQAAEEKAQLQVSKLDRVIGKLEPQRYLAAQKFIAGIQAWSHGEPYAQPTYEVTTETNKLVFYGKQLFKLLQAFHGMK